MSYGDRPTSVGLFQFKTSAPVDGVIFGLKAKIFGLGLGRFEAQVLGLGLAARGLGLNVPCCLVNIPVVECLAKVTSYTFRKQKVVFRVRILTIKMLFEIRLMTYSIANAGFHNFPSES